MGLIEMTLIVIGKWALIFILISIVLAAGQIALWALALAWSASVVIVTQVKRFFKKENRNDNN